MLIDTFAPDPSSAPRIAGDVASLIGAAEKKLPGVLKRIGQAEPCYSATEYIPLSHRVRAARQHGLTLPAAQKLVADLDAILEADDDAIRRMCGARCTDLSGWSDSMRALVAEAQANALRGLQSLPRYSPAEMIAQFKQRGIEIVAVGDNLHVSPQHRVTEADRDLLRTHKADIITALRAEFVVI